MPSLLLGAAVVVVATVLFLRSDIGSTPVVRGVAAPAFDLPTLGTTDPNGGARRSLASLKGRVVLVNFWATWCEPCEREIPAMERMYEVMPRDEFELLAISIDDKESDVKSFQERYGITFPILLDHDQSVYGSYQTMGVPESLLVDRDGRIVERYVGPREWDAPEYVDRIRHLIEGSDGESVPDAR